jgi:hypothetical protein
MNQALSFKTELDKKFKALKKSPSLSILAKRSNRLHVFILENTTPSTMYMRPDTDVYLRPVLTNLNAQIYSDTYASLIGAKS